MTDLLELTRNNPETQKDMELIFEKPSKKTSRTQSQINQTALKLKTVFGETIKMMGEKTEDMDKEIKLKDKTSKLLTDKMEISHEETLEQLENVTSTGALGNTERVRKRQDETLDKDRQTNY